MKKNIIAATLVVFGSLLLVSSASAETERKTETRVRVEKKVRADIADVTSVRSEFRIKSEDAIRELRSVRVRLQDTDDHDEREALVRNKLQNAIHVMETHLDRLEDNDKLSPEQFERRKENIEAVRARLVEIRARILAAKTDVDVEDIAHKIRNEHRETVRGTLDHFGSKLAHAIEVAEERSRVMRLRVNGLTNIDVNKDELNTMLTEADTSIANAKSALIALQTRVQNSEMTSSDISSLKSALTAIKEDLKKAYDSFRAVIEKVKSASPLDNDSE